MPSISIESCQDRAKRQGHLGRGGHEATRCLPQHPQPWVQPGKPRATPQLEGQATVSKELVCAGHCAKSTIVALQHNRGKRISPAPTNAWNLPKDTHKARCTAGMQTLAYPPAWLIIISTLHCSGTISRTGGLAGPSASVLNNPLIG